MVLVLCSEHDSRSSRVITMETPRFIVQTSLSRICDARGQNRLPLKVADHRSSYDFIFAFVNGDSMATGYEHIAVEERRTIPYAPPRTKPHVI